MSEAMRSEARRLGRFAAIAVVGLALAGCHFAGHVPPGQVKKAVDPPPGQAKKDRD